MGKKGDNASETLEQAREAERNVIVGLRDSMQAQIDSKEAALEAVKAQRKEAFNPYENLTNEFANLGVATQAAEFQAEETDIALANTLDTLEQTGASAGGATALALAALKSKQEVSASISEQEAANSIKRAEGERAAQDAKVRATERYQDTLIEQQTRVQDSEIAGEIFQYQAHEARSNADIELYAGLYSGHAANEAAARTAKGNASASMIGGIGDIVTGALGSDGFKGLRTG